MRRRSLLASVAVLAVAGGLTGCTSSSGPKPTDAAQTPTQLLAKARDTMNATSGVHVDMVGKDIPKDTNAVLSAKGDATPATPAWQGNVNLQFNGTALQVPVVAIKDDMWAQIFGSEQKIDPAKYKVPNPAGFFDKEHGLGSLLGKVTDAKFGDEKRVGKVIVQTVSGSISAAEVHSVFSIGPSTGKYDFTFGVDESTNQLLTMTINGPFYSNANASYDVSFDSYGQTVDIKAP
ncbi:LppX_LprAFG lipoprotein [Branchiibius hedensis]|nr:LppX_LprAFG lipoprotein [Branchiibius hedensis]